MKQQQAEEQQDYEIEAKKEAHMWFTSGRHFGEIKATNEEADARFEKLFTEFDKEAK